MLYGYLKQVFNSAVFSFGMHSYFYSRFIIFPWVVLTVGEVEVGIMAKILSRYKYMPQFTSVTQSCPTLCDPWTAACQASLSIANSQSLLKFMFIELGITIQPSHPLSSPSPPAFKLPASGSFPMSQFFTSGGQSIGVSASVSVLPMKNLD